jgi:hypothetical protein
LIAGSAILPVAESRGEGGAIEAGDLARVDIITVDKIAETCSNAPPHNK